MHPTAMDAGQILPAAEATAASHAAALVLSIVIVHCADIVSRLNNEFKNFLLFR